LNDASSDELEGTAKPSVTDPLINQQNLALLHKRDRTVIMGLGLVMSLAGTVVATLGRDDPRVTVAFAGLTVLATIALLAMIYSRGARYSGLEARLNSENAAARAINGHWWQIVHSGDHPGLSYIAIGISSVAERSAIVGRTYDWEGNVVATFSSDAVAIRTTSPIEIFYMWTGTVMASTKTPLVSGVGRFRFDSVMREDRPLYGAGMFTRGSQNLMVFEPARPVEVRRFTPDEEKLLNEQEKHPDGQECRLDEDRDALQQLAIAAYERFAIPKGVGLLELRTDSVDKEEANPHSVPVTVLD
jgi:hypothetical protein